MAPAVARSGSTSELTFLHYRKCKLVTVAGGTLELSDRDFTTDGKGREGSTRPLPTGLSGARGAPADGLRATCRLACRSTPRSFSPGRRADRIAEAAVYVQDQRDRPLFRFDLADRRATEAARCSAVDCRTALCAEDEDERPARPHRARLCRGGTRHERLSGRCCASTDLPPCLAQLLRRHHRAITTILAASSRPDGEPDDRRLGRLGRRVLLRPVAGGPWGEAGHRRRAGRGHRGRRRQPRSGRARLDPASLLRPVLGQADRRPGPERRQSDRLRHHLQLLGQPLSCSRCAI